MVDCRGTSAPLDMHAPPPNNDHSGASGDMVVSRATTPASAPPPPVHTYVPPMPNGGIPGGVGMGVGGYMAPAPYCSKPVVWMPHGPPPPPPPVTPHVYKSVQPNGADLPLNDIPTLRYYFNLGVECMMSTYGPPPQPPAKHYSPRDLTQDMQQMSLHNNREHNNDHNKYKDNKPPNNNKAASQRPLLGPRFKRGNQENNQGNNSNNHQNKHNNMNNNKGPNNRYGGERRGSHADSRMYEECPAEPLPALQYMYPPPLYPVYYPVEDPGMMGVMGGMGYVGYEEGLEYNMGMPMPYYPPTPYTAPPRPAHPAPPAALPPPPPQHPEHK